MLSPKAIAVGVVVLGLIGGGIWVGTQRGAAPDQAPDGDGAPSDVSTQVQDLLSKLAQVDGLQYDLEVTSPDGEFAAEVWQEYGGQNMRIEGSFEGYSGVVILTEDSQILHVPSQNMAVKINRGQIEQFTENTAESQTSEVQANLRDIEVEGSETFDGKDCLVVNFPQEGGTVRMWLWKDYGIPVKTVMEGEGADTVAELRNLEVKDIPASKFQLPAGVEVQEMPDIPSGDQIPEDMPEDIPSF